MILIGLIYIKYSPCSERINMHDSFPSLVTCGADRATDIGQHGKPKCYLSMTVLSVKLTPSLECHKPAWRHGAASFMKPIPALPQMSRGEFSTASQSLGRQSRKPYYIWGQAPLKLTATAATAKLAERGREGGMFTISTWQQAKLLASCSHLLWMVVPHKERCTLQLKMNKTFRVIPTALPRLSSAPSALHEPKVKLEP